MASVEIPAAVEEAMTAVALERPEATAVVGLAVEEERRSWTLDYCWAVGAVFSGRLLRVVQERR